VDETSSASAATESTAPETAWPTTPRVEAEGVLLGGGDARGQLSDRGIHGVHLRGVLRLGADIDVPEVGDGSLERVGRVTDGGMVTSTRQTGSEQDGDEGEGDASVHDRTVSDSGRRWIPRVG
jgi:hypothetical protein